MDLLTLFIAVALAHFLALLSPGPDFLLVVKSGVKHRARTAMGVALGIAAANACYIALCLVGAGAILTSSIALMTALKIAAGLFLTWLGVMALRAKKADYAFLLTQAQARTHAQAAPASSFLREFATGFASGILNPKNPLFYLSLFTLVLTNEVGMGFKLFLGVWMTLMVFFWDAFIILVLSRPRVRRVFNRIAFYIDKVAGAILGAVGLKILHSAAVDAQR